MSDVAQKSENNAETVVNGAADDGKAVESVENVAGDEKKQKKKKPNNKSKCSRNAWRSVGRWRHPIASIRDTH